MTGGGRLRMVAVAVLAAVLGAAAGIGGYRWYLNRGAEIRPLFALPDMNGERHSIAEWDGRVIVLNFWATWCAPCREEMPLLVDLQDKYGDQGLQIVGVALDRPDAVKAFADKMGLNYPVLLGVGDAMEVSARYGDEGGTLPYTVIIDRERRIRHVFARQLHRPDIEPVVREMLGDH